MLGRLSAARYVCLTPDLEIVIAELSFGNAEIRGMLIARLDGSFWFLGVDPGEIFSFVTTAPSFRPMTSWSGRPRPTS